jgi:ABC-type iron transport system FetAB permease component
MVISDEVDGATSAPGMLAGSRRALETPLPTGAQRALTFGLLLSALRCTVQYILLPFVLPWIGIASAIPPWVTLVLGGVAIASLTRNVRSLWRLHHARRWSYLAIALLVGGAIMVFMIMDLRALLGL